MSYNLYVSELAHSDIDEIVAYITKDLDNKTAAIRFLGELEKAYVNLAENPYMYEQSRIQRLARLGYRRVVIMNYVLMYLIDEQEDRVNILRLFYGKRNYAIYL